MSAPVKTHTYPFARIFIRLAIALAVLTIIAGAGKAALNVVSMFSKLQSMRYEPAPEMLLEAKALGDLYQGTQARLLQALEIERFPESVPTVDFTERLKKIERASPANRPALVQELAAETTASIAAMQAYHFAAFESAILSLRETLLTHAANLRARYAPSPSPADTPDENAATAAPSPPLAQPSGTAPARSQRFRIFSETGSDATFSDRRRLQTLEQAREMLSDLREQSKREESLDQIRKAQIFLTRAEGLLDQMPLAEAPSTPAPPPAIRSAVQRQEEEMVSLAERTAAGLQNAQEAVAAVLYSRWRVEEQSDRVAAFGEREGQEAQRLAASYRAVLVEDTTAAGLVLLIALGLAFAILVVSDFLRAFLNLSNNSDLLVLTTHPNPEPAALRPSPSLPPPLD